MSLENYNYYNDYRVKNSICWYEYFDENKMTVVFHDDEIGNIEIPVEFIICDVCNGKGTHVNPSIDCNGISSSEFYEDREFYEDYRSGVYDVKCYNCDGRRVIPWPVRDEDVELVEKWFREEYEYQALCNAERRMGA